ncbi:alcohol acetyltransferase-domain-containing protein [Dactylonectria estremocensis]|uniref:Alcohol acetyltransferase-domain-containing protein n=1 Tax=Dactylonectria estremocensis TaxID=1079267 RepID=A0A9P9J4W9_9HYPO|nr:alcohol acetyltransferase-domain-containing protein [Dactylonectria estremocensis]
MSVEGSTPGSKPRILRRLGPFEAFQSAMFQLDLYCGTTVICRYAIPENLRDPSLQGKLAGFWERAVADTILQHPLLQVGIIGRDSKHPSWVQLDHIDLSQHIEWRIFDNLESYDTTFDKTLKEQVDTAYASPETRPGWRVIVSRLNAENLLDVIFVWNHSNTDGTGGKLFHETLLQSLNKLRDESIESTLDSHLVKTTATTQNLPPPQDVVGKFSFTPQFTVAMLWKEFKPQMFAHKISPHKLLAPLYLTQTGTQSRRLTIDNATLQNVLAACRTRKTTLTGLLHGITLVSLVSLYKEEAPTEIISESPLNLRRFLPSRPPAFPEFEPSKAIGNFVTKMDHIHDEALVSKIQGLARGANTESETIAALEDVMWSVSKTVRQELKDKLDMGLKNELCGLMKLVGDYRGYFKDQMKKPREASWLVTNLGVIDGGLSDGTNPESWSIERAHFSLGANLVGSNLSISPVAVKGGPLVIGFSWQDEAVDNKLGDSAVVGIETWLKHIGSKK